MYLAISDITEIQLDHTSRCNLGCPQCARTRANWSQVPAHRGLDLSIEDYQILLEPFGENKIAIFHCGNFGDALASPTFDETFHYSLSKNPRRVTISTNGSLRTPDWWRELALSGGSRLTVTFAIDGLSDTNQIYRVGSNWEKILKNVSAFIEGGGRARWDFIEFEHNYHQIDEARNLAKALGFETFNVKYTARFASLGLQSETNLKGVEIRDRSSNENQKDAAEIESLYSSFDEYVLKTKISCKYQEGKKVFIDMNMKLWPCCWFGAPPYFTTDNKQVESFRHLENIYGADFNDMRKYGWTVLEHEFFQHHLEKSWKQPSDRYKRIYTCGRTCGEKFEFSSGYGKNSNLLQIR